MNNSIKPISKALSILFMVGGALMVISAGCFVFFWHRELMCWIFLLGAVLFSSATMKRKTKIPRKVWEFICTAAILACLILAAFAIFKK